jgi:hypothetical protein
LLLHFGSNITRSMELEYHDARNLQLTVK